MSRSTRCRQTKSIQRNHNFSARVRCAVGMFMTCRHASPVLRVPDPMITMEAPCLPCHHLRSVLPWNKFRICQSVTPAAGRPARQDAEPRRYVVILSKAAATEALRHRPNGPSSSQVRGPVPVFGTNGSSTRGLPRMSVGCSPTAPESAMSMAGEHTLSWKSAPSGVLPPGRLLRHPARSHAVVRDQPDRPPESNPCSCCRSVGRWAIA
jgi:hypothetical protein